MLGAEIVPKIAVTMLLLCSGEILAQREFDKSRLSSRDTFFNNL